MASPLYRSPKDRFTSRSPSNTLITSLPADRNILEGLSAEPTRSITKPEVDIDDDDIRIKNLKFVGSYNWIDSRKPTIIVPGSPPEWRNKATPFKVDPDSGIVFSDQNGYRSPKHILLPLIRAVEINNVDFDWSSVDFVTDRNGLRKLLRWIGASGESDIKEFRVDTQLAGEGTVLFNRWEKRFRESFDGRKYSTYGFNFETESTMPALNCEDSTGHHRIICYDLEGMKMVVRFEVDACIPPSNPKVKVGSKAASTANVDDLVDALAGVSLKSNSSPALEDEYGLCIRQAGSHLPQSNIVELATISSWRQDQFDWAETYPQLFLSQTPHHFLAVHERGRFTTIVKRRLGSPELKEIEKKTQNAFWKLWRVLKVIKDVVVKDGRDGRLSLLCQNGELKVYERTSKDSCLPETIMKKFEA